MVNIIDLIKIHFSKILFSLFCIISGIYLLTLILNLFPKFNISDFIFSFYPLFFLPLFIKKGSNVFKLIDYFLIIFSVGIFIFSKYIGFLTGMWISIIWLILTLSKGFGINIHIFGKFLFFIIPPFVDKYTIVFGFQLKLFLSKIAGIILKTFDPALIVSGNSILFKNKEFMIDDACQGLKMGIAIIVLLFVFLYRVLPYLKINLKNIFFISSCIFMTLFLWIFSNELRIIFLIALNIPSESIAHYIIGIILLILFNVLPLILFNEIVIYKHKKNENINIKNKKIFPFLSIALILIILSSGLLIKFKPQTNNIMLPEKICDFTKQDEIVTNSFFGTDYKIVSYKNNNQLIIVKNNIYPYRIIHHPKQCFEGEGYKIIKENYLSIKNYGKIRVSTIEKNGIKAYLYWWYQPINKNLKVTEDELEWRKNYFFSKTQYLQISYFTENIDGENIEKIINNYYLNLAMVIP